jgi:predicted nucleotide-binding protein
VEKITKRWDAGTKGLIQKIDDTISRIFGHDTIEYRKYTIHDLDGLPLIIGGGEYHPREIQRALKEEIAEAVVKLETLRESLEERVQDERGGAAARTSKSAPIESNNVFIVHGHDNHIKEAAARLVARLGLDPIVLHEQPNQGKTIIEKFESNSGVRFAIIICTPDDVGHVKDFPDKKEMRARQNVIAEMGFFIGKLGRQNIAVLHEQTVTLPSDFSGVAYITIDSAGAWKFSLAKEMKASGISVDFNKVA